MDQGDDGMAGDGSSKPEDGKRGRRPSPTIELTATSLPDQGSKAPDSEPPSSDASSEASLATEAVSSGDGLNPLDGNPKPPPPDDGKPRTGRRAWPVIGAAAAAMLLTAGVAGTVFYVSSSAPEVAANKGLTERLGAVETQLGQIEGRLKSAADPQDLAALKRRIGDIELQLRGMGPSQGSVDPNRVVALEGRLGDVTKRLAALEPVGRRLDEIAARIAKLEADLGQPRPNEPDPALSNRVSSVDTALKSLSGRVGDLEKRIDTLASAVRETASPAPPTGAPDPAMRLAFLATMLRNAVERGEPFAAELAALKALAPTKTSLAPLEAFATTGVPSTNALSHELSALVPALLAAANPPQGDATLMDRLGIKHLVRIRRVGDAPGDDPVSVIARIEVKAAHDDLAGALAEFTKLPETIRAPAAVWIKKATQRIAAVTAARELTADALAGLAGPTPKPAP